MQLLLAFAVLAFLAGLFCGSAAVAMVIARGLGFETTFLESFVITLVVQVVLTCVLAVIRQAAE